MITIWVEWSLWGALIGFLGYFYSWPSLVWRYTEEPFSRPFVGENQFWLVLQNHISTENAVGCLFFPPGTTFFALHSHAHCFCCSVGISNGFVLKQVTWICFSDKSMWPASSQIHLKCPLSSGSSVHVKGKKSCSWWKNKQPIAFSVLIRSWSTNQNLFSPTNGREISSSVYGRTRPTQLY